MLRQPFLIGVQIPLERRGQVLLIERLHFLSWQGAALSTAGTTHIELRHIVQPQAGQTAVLCAVMTAAAVDVDNPISAPDTEILIVPPGQQVRGRVAHDANDVRVRTPALCGHTAPDTGLAVSAGTAVDKVELLSTDYTVSAGMRFRMNRVN